MVDRPNKRFINMAEIPGHRRRDQTLLHLAQQSGSGYWLLHIGILVCDIQRGFQRDSLEPVRDDAALKGKAGAAGHAPLNR